MRKIYFLIVIILSSCNSGQRTYTALEHCYQLKDLTKKKAAIQPGDWRESYTEIHEPYKAYIARNPTSATAERTKLYVVRLGDFDQKGKEIFDVTKSHLASFFQIEVEELAPISESTIAKKYKRNNTYGEQIATPILLDSLLPSLLPDSGFALIAFSINDLYPNEEWNYVFGQASLQNRVGVWSMARLGDYNLSTASYNQCLLRTIKVATHETGHMFGIKHCVLNECMMNGSNSLTESDRQQSWLCWECLSKLCWNRKIMPAAHLRTMSYFYTKHNIDSKATYYYKSALSILAPIN